MSYEYFSDWLHKTYGMDLSAYKDAQMQRRLTNIMLKSGAKNFKEYALLVRDSEDVRQDFFNHVTINVTEFMRNKEKFDEFEEILTKKVSPRFKELKIWSAACSNGSEPYSIGIIADKKGLALKTRIIATDIDKTILEKAKEGKYLERDLKNVNQQDVDKYFKLQGDEYAISDRIKKLVEFDRHDLITDKFGKDYQVIVCRNVTIYFKNEARDDVYRKFSEALVPGGILFIGATESIFNPSSYGLKKISVSIYEKE